MTDESRLARFIGVLALGLLLPASARAVDVTTCGQVVPTRETGVLQVDLTSCPSSAVGVFLQDRAVLDLNGHAVASGGTGVHCLGRRCAVHGPGEVRNALYVGILASAYSARLNVADVDVHDNGSAGIIASAGKPRVALERVHAHDNAVGVEVIYRGRIAGEDVDASNNHGNGIVAGSYFHFKRLTLTGTTNGPYTGDGLVCLYGGGIIVDSTVTGSSGIDIVTVKRPKVVRSACGTSRRIDASGPTWGVCAND
jgi:hypothetical protein